MFDKVELAKMLGLEICDGDVREWEIEDLRKFEYMTIDKAFNAGITVEINKEDLNIIEYFENSQITEDKINSLVWKRAADEYLGKIKSLVETIRV